MACVKSQRGVLGNIRVKNLSQRDCKYKINDQMGKHVNQSFNLFFFSPLKDTGAFSLAVSNTGQRTLKSRCCNERYPTALVIAKGGTWETISVDSS